jgi:hypothetical protein
VARGKIRIRTLIKLLYLCEFTLRHNRLPTINEVMQEINCSKSHAYNYLRAAKILYPEQALERLRQREIEKQGERDEKFVQQVLQ